jgi:hypothetical protein
MLLTKKLLSLTGKDFRIRKGTLIALQELPLRRWPTEVNGEIRVETLLGATHAQRIAALFPNGRPEVGA